MLLSIILEYQSCHLSPSHSTYQGNRPFILLTYPFGICYLSSNHWVATTVLEVFISKHHSSDVVYMPNRSHKIHFLSEEANILNLRQEEKWERSHILKLLPFFVRTSLYEISEKKGRNVPDEEEQWNFLLWR